MEKQETKETTAANPPTTNRTVQRNYKDRLFCRLFSEKEYALSLYNALRHTSYTNANELEVVTLEDAIYMSMKNDVAILFQNQIVLFEQQSSYNPNMPLRGLLYYCRVIEAYITRKDLWIYGKKQIPLPAPDYYVLYNGEEEQPERTELLLSDAFMSPQKGYEWTAHMININAGKNPEILSKSKILSEYSEFIASVRKVQTQGYRGKDAIGIAIDHCIQHGILFDFLVKHKAEVETMLLTEFDEVKFRQRLIEESKQEGREEGRQEGREEGREEGIYGAIFICRDLNLSEDIIIKKLQEKFQLSEEEAKEYLEVEE